MENTGFSFVTLVLLLPLIGFFLILFFQREEQAETIKWTALVTSIVTFFASLLLWAGFDGSQAGLQFVTRWDWIPQYHISFFVGIDGLSLLLVILTTFIMPLAILSSFRVHVLHERGRVKLYFMFMLLLEWAMLGVFMVQDLFLFYIFWEVSLVPMYFLIGIWGAERRVYAAVKFFLYTMAGSLLMLLAILYVGSTAGTFSVPDIIAGVQNGTIVFPFDGLFSTQGLLFLGFLIAFAIKVPIWPLHSWLPDAHVQAPTAGSVILAGVMLKLGTYGIVRFCLPMFPQASVDWAPIIATLAVIGIIYGAWVSYAQTDVKKLVAYSSVSHLGFVVLGIFAMTAAGLQGALLQMVNHGISTGGLFLVVGMLYERRHTKAMDAYGGIWKAHAAFGRAGADHHAQQHGPARLERLRRRVHDLARLVRQHRARLLLHHVRHAGRHPRGDLPALHVPERLYGRTGQRGEQASAAAPLAGDRRAGPDPHRYPPDRFAARAVLCHDGCQRSALGHAGGTVRADRRSKRSTLRIRQ